MDFRVPMIELVVLVALNDSEPADYSVFLTPYSPRREGPERIEDYLNGLRRFLPMMQDGVPKIVNREQVVWVLLSEGDSPGSDAEPSVLHKPSTLELVGGTELEGYLQVDRPADSARVSDLLNDPHETFVRLDSDSVTYFVNKRYIRVATPR